MKLPALLSADLLVEDLAWRIRYVIAQHFRDPDLAAKLLERLAREGWLGWQDVVSVPVTTVELLHQHVPGESSADWESLADELRRRWSAQIVAPVRLYFASLRTIHRVGGEMAGRVVQPDAVAHDLGTAATFLYLADNEPILREAWTPEERVPPAYGQVHPDALLADTAGARVIVEFCGMYTAERLQRLAEFANSRRLPLQLFTCAGQGAEL